MRETLRIERLPENGRPAPNVSLTKNKRKREKKGKGETKEERPCDKIYPGLPLYRDSRTMKSCIHRRSVLYPLERREEEKEEEEGEKRKEGGRKKRRKSFD